MLVTMTPLLHLACQPEETAVFSLELLLAVFRKDEKVYLKHPGSSCGSGRFCLMPLILGPSENELEAAVTTPSPAP